MTLTDCEDLNSGKCLQKTLKTLGQVVDSKSTSKSTSESNSPFHPYTRGECIFIGKQPQINDQWDHDAKVAAAAIMGFIILVKVLDFLMLRP